MWRYKYRFLLFMAVLVLLSVVGTIQPYFYKLFVDVLTSQSSEATALQLDWQIGTWQVSISLWTILLTLIAFRFLDVALDLLAFWLGDKVLFPAGRDARLTVFSKIQDLDFAYHLSKSTGSLISAMKRGDGAFFSMHHILNIQFTELVIGLLVMLFFMATIHPFAVLILFAQIVINLLATIFLVRFNIERRRNFIEQEDKISAIIVDNMINYETVKLFSQEESERRRLRHQFKKWNQALWGYANSFRLIDLTIGGLTNIGFAALLYLGLWYVIQDSMTLGDYVMILGFMQSFYPSFFRFVYELRNLAKHQTDIEKYFAVLDEDTKVKDPVNPVKKDSVAGKIEFRDLNFSYPEGKQDAVNGLDLVIQPGESVAFVGHSGVGKTTLIKLLMRFYDPDQGQILLDDIDIKNFSKSQLRSFLGVVPQDPVLFNDTVKFNLAYGSPDASDAEIKRALKIANLEDFIDELPAGLKTMVGERGVKLSGGQKQRLAIARMILANPEIVIFDEATSQLDSESEKKIQDAFWKASKDKTTLIIAHRLSTIARADRIVVMQAGKIFEMGTHQELLARDGVYAHLWNLQSI